MTLQDEILLSFLQSQLRIEETKQRAYGRTGGPQWVEQQIKMVIKELNRQINEVYNKYTVPVSGK